MSSTISSFQPLICSDEADYHRLMADTFIEKYFELIASHSFKAHFISLSMETAQLLLNTHANFLENVKCGAIENWPSNVLPLDSVAKQLTNVLIF